MQHEHKKGILKINNLTNHENAKKICTWLRHGGDVGLHDGVGGIGI